MSMPPSDAEFLAHTEAVRCRKFCWGLLEDAPRSQTDNGRSFDSIPPVTVAVAANECSVPVSLQVLDVDPLTDPAEWHAP